MGSTISSVNSTATGTISTGSYSWNYTRTLTRLKSNSSDYIALQGSTWIQLGSGNALESLSFDTNNIPGVITSVTVVAASSGGSHDLTVKVGGTKYLDGTTLTSYSNAASATNPDPANCEHTGTGQSSGAIEITIVPNISSGQKALLIRSISVTFKTLKTN